MRPIAAALLVVLAGCSESPTDVSVDGGPFFGREPLSPVPASYADWYGEVEACLGVQGNFAAVDWFLADSIVDPQLGRRVGLWTPPDTITLMRGFEDVRYWVRRYMIQQVLQTDSSAPTYNENGRQRCPPYTPVLD